MILRLLFRRGYHMNETDRKALHATPLEKICFADQIAYDLCNRLDNRDLVDDVFYHQKLLLIFESISQKRIIGFKYGADNWVAFANNAIEFYQKYWDNIELALKRAELWETIIQSDKKGTFKSKLDELGTSFSSKDNGALAVLFDLFPHLTF